MATKKKQPKTRRKSTARRGATKRAKPGKKKAATKKRTKKATKARAKPRRKPAVKLRARPKPAAKRKAKPAAKRTTAARKPPRPAAVSRAAAAPEHDLREEIEVTLFRRDIDRATPGLVDVLSAVARGYRSGPAAPPPGVVIDVNTPIADALVTRYERGDREPDRRMHRPQVLATVGFNLDQLGLGDTGEAERAVLTTLCLGSWDPATQTHAQLDGTASFLVGFYRAGK